MIVFYNITWFVTFVSIIGTFLNVKRSRAGFAVWMVTNSAWAVDGVKVLMGIIQQIKSTGVDGPVIDLPALRAAWQVKMNGVMN